MTTEEREEPSGENELDLIANGAQELAVLHGRIGTHFRRAEVRERVGRFLEGLLAQVERKNGCSGWFVFYSSKSSSVLKWRAKYAPGPPFFHVTHLLFTQLKSSSTSIRNYV